MNLNYIPENTPLILVVDNDQSIRMLLRVALEKENYRFIEATNGEECLVAYKNYQPNIILLDAVMPDMDGFTCCSKLRTMAGSDHLSILMITILDDPKSVEQAFLMGATDYITKPINWAVLRHRLRKLIEESLKTQQIALLKAELAALKQELNSL